MHAGAAQLDQTRAIGAQARQVELGLAVVADRRRCRTLPPGQRPVGADHLAGNRRRPRQARTIRLAEVVEDVDVVAGRARRQRQAPISSAKTAYLQALRRATSAASSAQATVKRGDVSVREPDEATSGSPQRAQ